VLLEQPFIKDQAITISELSHSYGETGEKIKVRRFTRYKMAKVLRSDLTILPMKWQRQSSNSYAEER